MRWQQILKFSFLTALGAIFVDATIALVLFVILEVQWIIYWNRLLKRQKINSETPP